MLGRLFSLIGLSWGNGSLGMFNAVVSNGFPPYGTIVGTSTQSTYLSWYWSSYPSYVNQFEWGTHQYDIIADGNGGVFAGSDYNFVDTTAYNTVIKEDLDYSQFTRIIYKGNGSWSECNKVASTGNSGTGTLYININGNDYDGGSYYYTEYYDGFCGTYNDQTNYWYPYGTPIFGDGTYNYFCDGSGGYYSEYAGGGGNEYPPYGTLLIPEQSGTYYTQTPCGAIATGDWYDDADYADGNGGYFNDGTSYYNHMPYGTYITNCNGDNLYSDGSEGYYVDNGGGGGAGNPPYGEFLYSDGGSSYLTWYAPDGSYGDWTYASWGCSYYADGMGGSYSSCGGYTEYYGTQITSGSYSYENGTDEWGNPQYSTASYAIYFDGYGGYYTNTW